MWSVRGLGLGDERGKREWVCVDARGGGSVPREIAEDSEIFLKGRFAKMSGLLQLRFRLPLHQSSLTLRSPAVCEKGDRRLDWARGGVLLR